MSNKKELQLEYEFRASPAILFDFLTNPSNLAQWFADHCDVTGDEFTFVWNGYEEKAIAEELIQDKYLKWVWKDDEEKVIQFSIKNAEITGGTILTIIDQIDEDEMEDQELLWDNQIKTLKVKCGG